MKINFINYNIDPFVIGEQLYSKVIITDSNSYTVEAVDPYTRLAPGTYYIVGSSNNNLFHKKLVIR